MLPSSVEASDAPTEYAGTSWAQLLWPPATGDRLRVSLMHESFHIVQPRLGFTGFPGSGSISGDAFLDTELGRIWFRGELHALRTALRCRGSARRLALADALVMREYRHSLFEQTAEQEREQDIMEGLAESTGIDAGLPSNRRIAYAVFDVDFVEAQPSYARSFAYATGPAYSELLDAAAPDWRRSVTLSSDIAEIARRTYGSTIDSPNPAQVRAIIGRYGGAAIEAQESSRAARKARRDETYLRVLVGGSTISLPMRHFSITFNPRDIEALAPYGSVYHTLKVADRWGSIAVFGGDALISSDFRNLTVAAPPGFTRSVTKGRGWTLDLATGYRLVVDPRKRGSYVISAGR